MTKIKFLVDFFPAVIIALLVIFFSLVYPIFFAETIKYIEINESPYAYLYIYLFSLFMSFSLVHLRELLSFYHTNKYIEKLQQKFYRTYISSDTYNRVNTSKFHYLFNNIFETTLTLIENIIFTFIPLFFQILVVSIIVLYIYPIKYFLFIFFTVLLFISFILIRNNKIKNLHRIGEQLSYELGFHLQETAENFETIYSYQLRKFYKEKFNKLNKMLINHELKTQKFGEISKFFLVVIFFIPTIVMTLQIIYDIGSNFLQLSDFVLLTSYTMNIFLPMNTVGQGYKDIKKKYMQFQEIKKFLYENLISNNALQSKHYKPLDSYLNPTAKIKLDNISLFVGETQILRDVSLTIDAKKTYFLTGSNGSGKTSLIRIMSGIYLPTSGTLSLNKDPPSKETLVNIVSLAPQNTTMFEGTILYNITFDDENYDEDRLKIALKISCLDTKLNHFTKGIHTVISKNRYKVSGGEQHLISIARAIYKKAAVYIFDEPTSNLDKETRKKVLNNLCEMSMKSAVIISEHENIPFKCSVPINRIHLKNGKLDASEII